MSKIRAEQIGTPDGLFTTNIDDSVGGWSSDVTWNSGNIVNRNGALYVCKTNDHVSVTPPEDDATNWKTATQFSADTLSDMRDLPTATNAVAYMKGYSSIGDGGQGKFVFDSSNLLTEVSADTQSGIYVAPSSDLTGASGAWVRQYNNEIYARWFGVVGDAVADDTVALQAAFDALEDGYVLHINGLICGVSSTISLTNDISFSVRGGSPTTSAVRAIGGTSNFDIFTLTGLNGLSKEFRDIELGQLTSGAYNNIGGFNLVGCNGVSFHNVWTRGLLFGIKANGSFIGLNNVTAEFCYKGVVYDGGGIESYVSNFTGYKNERDIEVLNTANGFIINGVNVIGTKDQGVYVNGSTGVTIDNATLKNDGTAYNPYLIYLSNVSDSNVSNIYSEFGDEVVFMSNCIRCNVDQVNGNGTAKGVDVVTSSYINVSNVCGAGITGEAVFLNTSPNCGVTNVATTTCGSSVRVTASSNAQISLVRSDSDNFVDSGNNTNLTIALVNPDPTLTSSGATKYN